MSLIQPVPLLFPIQRFERMVDERTLQFRAGSCPSKPKRRVIVALKIFYAFFSGIMLSTLRKSASNARGLRRMSGKVVKFGVEGRAKMLAGVNLLADAVQVSF